jgi:HEAT repeat protein
MHQLLIGLVFWTGAMLAGLTLLIVANKGWRETREALDRRRRTVLEPRIFAYVHAGDRRPIHDHLPERPSRRDRRLSEAILLDAARTVRGGARDRISAAFESLGSVRAAIMRLKSRRWWARADAAERLGMMSSRAAVEPLVTAMNDPAVEVRIRAARALGIIRGRASIRPLVGALGDPSRWSAIRVAEILISVGAEAVDELLAAYDTLPIAAQVSALDILGRIRSLKATDRVRRALHDPHPDLRARAAHALGLIGDPGFADDLIAALADPEWPVRAMAAKALGRIEAKAAIPALEQALTDRQWWVRANAGDALRLLGDAGREALIRALESEDTYARHQAVAQLQEGRIIDEYVAALASPDPSRRDAAVRFVERITSLKRIDRLTQQAVEATQEGVRAALSRILARPPEEA